MSRARTAGRTTGGIGRAERGERGSAPRRAARALGGALAAAILAGCGLGGPAPAGLPAPFPAEALAGAFPAAVSGMPEAAARLAEALPSAGGGPFREDEWRFRAGVGLSALVPAGNTDADSGFYFDGHFEARVFEIAPMRLDVIVGVSGGYYTLNEGLDSTFHAFPFLAEGQVGLWLVPKTLRIFGGAGVGYFLNGFETGPQDIAAGTLQRTVDDGWGPVFTGGLEAWSRTHPRVVLGVEGKYWIESVDFVDTTAGPPVPGRYDLDTWVIRVRVAVPF